MKEEFRTIIILAAFLLAFFVVSFYAGQIVGYERGVNASEEVVSDLQDSVNDLKSQLNDYKVDYTISARMK